MQKIDATIVKVIQLRAPRVSTSDVTFISCQLREGIIFSAFTASERSKIWIRLKQYKYLIPSLFIFF